MTTLIDVIGNLSRLPRMPRCPNAASALVLAAVIGACEGAARDATPSAPLPELRAGNRRVAVAAATVAGEPPVVLTVESGSQLATGRLRQPAAEAWVRRARDLLGRPLASRRPAGITEEAPLRGDSGGVVFTLARSARADGRAVYWLQASGAPERGNPGVVVIPDLSAARARAFVDAVHRATMQGGQPGRANPPIR